MTSFTPYNFPVYVVPEHQHRSYQKLSEPDPQQPFSVGDEFEVTFNVRLHSTEELRSMTRLLPDDGDPNMKIAAAVDSSESEVLS